MLLRSDSRLAAFLHTLSLKRSPNSALAGTLRLPDF